MELPEGTLEVLDTFIKEFVKDRDVVLGVSGGIDSALVGFLLKRNLPKEKIHLYSLPVGKESPDVKKVCNFLNLNYQTVNIDEALNFFRRYSNDMKSLGNVMARLRMVFLYEMANIFNGFVAGTSNKSELLTGYFTKFGDGGTDFQPIGDLYKTQVYQLAKLLNFPGWLMEKKPSANLWEGQTDEEELGINYSKLDEILECIEYFKKPEECKIEGVDIKEIERIYRMVLENSHKRVILYIPKIGFRSVGTDWLE